MNLVRRIISVLEVAFFVVLGQVFVFGLFLVALLSTSAYANLPVGVFSGDKQYPIPLTHEQGVLLMWLFFTACAAIFYFGSKAIYHLWKRRVNR